MYFYKFIDSKKIGIVKDCPDFLILTKGNGI